MTSPPSTARVTLVYYLITGLRWFAVALPLPLIYLFMGERGLGLLDIGALSALHAATIVALELPTGGLADAVGRKRVTQLAYAVSLAAGLTMLLAFSFWVFAVAWLLLGTARALNSGALDAWFIDSLQAGDPEIELQPALARAAGVEIAGLALGTLIGGLLPGLFPGLASSGGAILTPLTTTLIASLAVQAVALLLVTLLVVEVRPQGGTEPTGSLKQVSKLVREALVLSGRNPTIVLLLAAGAIGAIAITAVETFWQPRFGGWLDTGTNSALFGLLMTGGFVLGLLGNLAATPLSRLFRHRHALAAAAAQLLAGVGLTLLALQATPLPAALLFLLFYGGVGVVGSPGAALLNAEIPAARRSSMLSVASLTGYLGAAAAALLLGLLADRGGIGSAWLVAGGLTLASTVLYLAVDRRQHRPGADANASHPAEPVAG